MAFPVTLERPCLAELERLAGLCEQGVISEEDFEAKKRQWLGLDQGVWAQSLFPDTGAQGSLLLIDAGGGSLVF